MMNIVFKCSNEVKEFILSKISQVQESNQLNTESILILEVNSIEDLIIDSERDYALAIVIENGDLIFDILEHKPDVLLRKNKLQKDVELLVELNRDRKRRISRILEFKSGHLTVRLNVNTIIYIESLGHYLQIHTTSGVFMVRDKLKDVLKRLEAYNYKQIHKSYVVNMNYVKMMNNKICILKDDTELTIGRMYK